MCKGMSLCIGVCVCVCVCVEVMGVCMRIYKKIVIV